MNFDTLPAEYEKRASMADFTDESTEQTTSDIEERIRRAKAKNRRRDVLAIGGAMLFLLLFRTAGPWWSCLGLGLVIAGVAQLEFCYFRYGSLGRNLHFAVPRTEFLAAERKIAVARLRLINRSLASAAIVSLPGMLLYAGGLMKSPFAYGVLAGVLTVSTPLVYLAIALKFNRELRLTVERIDGELADYLPQAAA